MIYSRSDEELAREAACVSTKALRVIRRMLDDGELHPASHESRRWFAAQMAELARRNGES